METIQSIRNHTQLLTRLHEVATKRRDMEDKKIQIKKVPPIKAEPTAEDIVELLERIYPNDLKDLYFFIVGVLTARGYEFVD